MTIEIEVLEEEKDLKLSAQSPVAECAGKSWVCKLKLNINKEDCCGNSCVLSLYFCYV